MKLDMLYFFESIKNIPYVVTKIDVPYVPSDFPIHYAVGKDVDILVGQSDFQAMKDKVVKFASQFEGGFKIVKKMDSKGFRLRFMGNKGLHFQIDVSSNVKGIDTSIIEEAIENRTLVRNYYVAEPKYEIVFRYLYYGGRENKRYHLDYIWKHINDIDNEILGRAGIDVNSLYEEKK